MKINKTNKGTWEFYYSTGRRVPTKSDPTKLKYEVLHRVGFATKSDAEKAYIALKSKYEGGGSDSNQKVSEFFAEWFPMYCRNSKRGKPLALRTVESYQSYWDNHIQGFFGHMVVSSLTAHDVALFLDKQITKGLDPVTIKKHYNLLSLMFNAIALRGFINRNYVLDVSAPKAKKKTKEEKDAMVLNKEQQTALIKQVNWEYEYSDDYYAHFMHAWIHMALSIGLRRSEMLGLLWSDIVTTMDKEKGKFVHVLKVQRSLNIDGTFKGIKTEGGDRDIPLDAELVELLFAFKVKQLGYDWQENNLIFASINGTTEKGARVSQRVTDFFRRACVVGTSHTLRHTCITNWLNTVPNIKLVSTLAGHSNVSTTLDRYGHVLEENAISELDNLYSTMRAVRG